MQAIATRPHLATKVAAAASVVVLGLSLILSGCGHNGGNGGTNAGNQPGNTTTTSQQGGSTTPNGSGASVNDLQNLSDSVNSDINSMTTDENAANVDQSNQDVEVQP